MVSDRKISYLSDNLMINRRKTRYFQRFAQKKMSNLIYKTETNVSVVHTAKVAKERN